MGPESPSGVSPDRQWMLAAAPDDNRSLTVGGSSDRQWMLAAAPDDNRSLTVGGS